MSSCIKNRVPDTWATPKMRQTEHGLGGPWRLSLVFGPHEPKGAHPLTGIEDRPLCEENSNWQTQLSTKNQTSKSSIFLGSEMKDIWILPWSGKTPLVLLTPPFAFVVLYLSLQPIFLKGSLTIAKPVRRSSPNPVSTCSGNPAEDLIGKKLKLSILEGVVQIHSFSKAPHTNRP